MEATRVKRLYVSRELVVQELTKGNVHRETTVVEGLPTGSKLVGAWLDHLGLCLIFENEEFPEVDNPNFLPIIDTVFQLSFFKQV